MSLTKPTEVEHCLCVWLTNLVKPDVGRAAVGAHKETTNGSASACCACAGKARPISRSGQHPSLILSYAMAAPLQSEYFRIFSVTKRVSYRQYESIHKLDMVSLP